MTKKILILIAIFVAIFILYYKTLGSDSDIQVSELNLVEVDTAQAVSKPFDFQEYLKNDGYLGQKKVENPKTGQIVSYVLLTGAKYQARNPTFETYIDKEKIGEIVAQGATSFMLSSDNTYLVFRGRLTMGCGGLCQAFSLHAINFVDRSLSTIPLPIYANSYNGSKKEYSDITEYVEISGWADSTNIRIISFLVGIPVSVSSDNPGTLRRVSSKQIWNYNLVTKEYTLVQTLSE